MLPQSIQIDPLNSPHPVPWNWVMAMLATTETLRTTQLHYYRTHTLLSPDGTQAAYSRIRLQLHPNFVQSRISSVLFLENLKTGDLQAVPTSAPLADNPFTQVARSDMNGAISIVIPVAWSEQGDCLLAREFESLFGADLASDYGVIWNRQSKQSITVAPITPESYTNAVLLGWSRSRPGCALFRAGHLGEDTWPQWTVDASGQTTAAAEDQPQTFGQIVTSIWTGPQTGR